MYLVTILDLVMFVLVLTFTCELFSNKTSKIVSNFISNIDDHLVKCQSKFS